METVEKFLSHLSSTNYLVRKFSLYSLQKIPLDESLYERVFRGVVDALNDSNGEVRRSAIETLDIFIHQRNMRVDSFQKELIKNITEILSHKEPQIRAQAVEILTVLTIRDQTNGKVHGASLVGKLTAMLEDPHPRVRLATLKGMAAISQVGAPLRSSVDNLIQFLLQEERKFHQSLHAGWKDTYQEAFLKNLYPPFEQIASSPEEKGGRIDFVMGFNQLLDDPNQEEGELIIKWIRDIYHPSLPLELRVDVMKKLIYFGMHTHSERIEQTVGQTFQAIFAQEGLESPLSNRFFLNPEEEDNLFSICLSTAQEGQVAFWAAKMLGLVLSEIPLPEALMDHIKAKLENRHTTLLAITLLRELGRANSNMAMAFYEKIISLSLTSPTLALRQNGTATLGRLKVSPEAKDKISDALIRLLQEGDESIRIIAARSIERMIPNLPSLRKKALLPLLNQALDSSSSYSRTYAEILGALLQEGNGIPDNGILKLQKGLESKEPMVQENSLWLLTIVAQYYPKADLTKLLSQIRRLYRNSDCSFMKREVLSTLMELMNHPSLKSEIGSILELLVSGLEDPHLLVSEAASLSLDSIFKEYSHG